MKNIEIIITYFERNDDIISKVRGNISNTNYGLINNKYLPLMNIESFINIVNNYKENSNLFIRDNKNIDMFINGNMLTY
jgi:hypothetical protein